MFNFHFLSYMNKPVVNRVTIFFTTLITLLSFNSSRTIQSQTISAKNNNILFYGTDTEATSMGAEYILFQDKNHNLVRGLVYVQNSDVFSCFQADYDRQNQSFGKVIYAYPKMGTEEWVKQESQETMSLENFPHQLNHTTAHENAKQLFNQCLDYFEGN